MEGITAGTLRVYDALVKGRGTAKEAAIRAIDGGDGPVDREHLRMLVLRALMQNFTPPKPSQNEDLKSSDTRCWLLSALGRLCAGDPQSAALVRQHLDRTWEPYKWARYWAFE